MEAHVSLRAEPTEIGVARRFVAERMSRWHSGHDTDTAILLVSELVTNAVVHAHSGVYLSVRLEEPVLTVEVLDAGEELPTVLDTQLDSTRGRGMRLVASLADDWGIRPIPGHGKAVWFALMKR